MQYEIETELDLCFANPYMKEIFLQAKNLGKTIIAVSDMYLSKDVIEKMLIKCGYEGFDNILFQTNTTQASVLFCFMST